MWSYGVVVYPPFFQGGSGFVDREKPLLIEAFLPQPAVEGFDKGIIGGGAGSAENQLHAALVCPGI